MKVFHYKQDLESELSYYRTNKRTIGFVPTMGALHKGHLSLVRKSLHENDVTVTSIFVNPTQFNNAEDLEKYPRVLNQDLELLKQESENILVYAPTPQDVYDGPPYSSNYELDGLDLAMEGEHRPGHFKGVATVVELLLDAVKPTKAYFGEKDFQQLQIIKKLVDLKGIGVKIIGCPIVREENGLALSSRNRRLSDKTRNEAGFIRDMLLRSATLTQSKSPSEIQKLIKSKFEAHPLFELEYFEIANIDSLTPAEVFEENQVYRAFIAVYADGVRLIDNISLAVESQELPAI